MLETNRAGDEANGASVAKRVSQFFKSDVAFAILLSAVLVGLRVLLFDFHFIKLHMVPNHDMSQAASFFATNMHSLRLTGELAFWNPATANGYAQYFQSFLSPLAPTPNHIVFILWAEAIKLLSLVHVNVPEYSQYISFTYIFMPFLTFVAGTLFFRQIYENRSVIAILMLAYAFSSIGIWNSAWFYFEESFTLFAVLGTSIAYLKKPTMARLWLCLAALLVQVCSANYWTVHNSWLYILGAASYAFAFPNQVRRAVVRIVQAANVDRRKTVAVVSLLALTVGLWVACLGSIFVEQSKHYIRPTISTGTENYKTQAVLSRVHELRRSTVEFFNPNLDRALKYYQYESDVHNARYVGLVFLPFLFLLPFYPWRRKERFIAGLAFGTLVVCLGFPLIAMLWTITPMLSRDQHLFYFYTQYLQVALIMGAAAALEVVLQKRGNSLTQRRLTSAMLGVVALSFCGFAAYNLLSGGFAAKDMNLETGLYVLTTVLVVSGFAAQHLLSGKKESKRMLTAALVTVALLDLTSYFAHVSEKDAAFSNSYLLTKRYRTQVHEPAYAAVRCTPTEPRTTAREISQHRAVINKPWANPDLSLGFSGGLFKNMPIFTDFWPVDRFLEPTNVVEFKKAPLAVQEHEFTSAPIQLTSYIDPQYDDMPGSSAKFVNDDPKLDDMPEAGVEHHDATALVKDTFVPNFKYAFQNWAYNDFKISMDAPRDGLLIIHQLPDKLWKLKLDGQPVTFAICRSVDMTIPLSEGKHELQMDYLPLARKLYWPAAWLLQLSLVGLLFAAYRSRKP
ncbi:MAG: hypothetical protein JST89_03020 [Cyanobacteria bacterium SZAS-4]|nr:hypothetical protein [Cyanobacteria bacterium SZAS-4]